MHEWALAEAVVASVKEHIKDHDPSSVRSVIILFGELQNIDPEIFRSGLKIILQGEKFDEDVFITRIEKAAFLCNNCTHEWHLDEEGWNEDQNEDQSEAIHFLPEAAHAYLRCPTCGSPDFRTTSGRGISIQSIELEESF